MTEISTRGMIEIMSHEGICLEPYLDSVGVWTIGVGQTKSDDIDPRTHGKLTIDEAVDLFKRKVKQYTNAVDALGLTLTQYQYDALTSFCYNVGPGNLRTLCHNRSIAQIGEAFSLYHIPPEITERRNKEQALFKTGKYSNADGKVLVFPVANNKPQYSKGYNVDVRPYFEPAPVVAETAPAKPVPPPPPVAQQPEPKPSAWAALASLLASLFTRKA
jgi:lysozyme